MKVLPSIKMDKTSKDIKTVDLLADRVVSVLDL